MPLGTLREHFPTGRRYTPDPPHILRKTRFLDRAPVPNEQKDPLVSELAARHGVALHRFLASRLRTALAEVPDLVQEVFLRLLRNNRMDAIRSPEAYLFGIARHVLHQHRTHTSNS